MNYDMEELIPIVAKLAEKYTGFESTSITYEKAEQLMGAVIYCINEMEREADGSILSSEKMPALQAYEIGLERVREKTEAALRIYNETVRNFSDYGNICLQETFIKGMPEFFKWYDIRFEPQNTILTLDYPILCNIQEYSGIDRIYEYIECIRLEQSFLKQFPADMVEQILKRYNPGYKEMIDNICEIVYGDVVLRMLEGRTLGDDAEEYVEKATKELIEKYYDNDIQLFEYLRCALRDIIVRLRIRMEGKMDTKRI